MRVAFLSLAAVSLLGLIGHAQPGGDQAAVARLIDALKSGSDDAKRKAIEEIGKLGPQAKDAVPALTHFVKNYPGGEMDALAIVALGKIGPAASSALPALHYRATSVMNGQQDPTENACIAIGRIGAWSPATTRSVLPLFHNPAYFAANPEVTLPQLFDLLTDNNQEVRIGAVKSWRRLAENRDDDVLKKYPKLRAKVAEYASANLNGANPQERRHVVDLFRTLFPDQTDKIIPVAIQLHNEKAIEWRVLDQMLSGRGENRRVHDDVRKKALPALIASFADAPPAVHAQIVEYLGFSHFHEGIVWMPGALADRNARVRAGAAAAAQRTNVDKKIVEQLRGMLKDPEQAVRFQVASALVTHDRMDDAAPVLAVLIECMRHPDQAIRLESAQQLRNLGAAAEPAAAVLLDSLGDPSMKVRAQAVDVLISLDAKHGKRVVPVLRDMLHNHQKDYNIMAEAFRLTTKLGASAGPLVPDLVAIMETNGQWFGPAAQAFESIGPGGKEAIPALQKILKEREQTKSTNVRDLGHFYLALAKLGAPEHRQATRALLPFMPRSDQSILLSSYYPHYPNETVSELAKLLDDIQVRDTVLRTFERMTARNQAHRAPAPDINLKAEVRAELKTALLKLLDDDNLHTKVHSMKVLLYMEEKPPTEKLIAVIRACLARNDSFHQPIAMFMQGNEKILIPVFIEEAAKQDNHGRYYSVFMEARPAAFPILLGIAKTDSSRQCVHAAWGLAGMAYGKMTDDMRTEATKALVARLPELKSPERGQVALAILQINTKSPPPEAIVAVGEHLLDANVKTPGEAAFALRQLGKNAAPATKQLQLALGHANSYVQLEAAACLMAIDKKYTNETLPVARKALEGKFDPEAKDANSHVASALHLCRQIGPEARPLLPRVLEISRTQQPRLAILATEATVAIDKAKIPEVAKNVTALLGKSKVQDRSDVNKAHRLLRDWGKLAAGADEPLVPLLKKDPDYQQLDVAVTLIVLQGPGAEKGVAHFRRALSTNDDRYGGCSDALHLFTELKSHGKAFLPELRKLLGSTNQYDREETIRAIGEIGPDAKELLPDLRRHLEKTKDDFNRRQLEDTIKRISPPAK